MKIQFRTYLLVFLAITLLGPQVVHGAETTPHEIPWIEHKATIDPGGGVYELDFGPEGIYLGVKYNHKVRIFDVESQNIVSKTNFSGSRAGEELTYDGSVIGPKAEKFFVGAGY